MIIADIIINDSFPQTDIVIEYLSTYLDFAVGSLKPAVIKLNTSASIVPRVGLFGKTADIPAVLQLKSICGKNKNRMVLPISFECEKLRLSPLELKTYSNIGGLKELKLTMASSANVLGVPPIRYYDNDLLTRLDPYTLNELDLGI